MRKVLIVLIFILLGAAGVYYFGGGDKIRPLLSPTPTPYQYTLATKATYSCLGKKTIEASFFNGPQIAVKPGEPPSPTGKVGLILSDGRSLTLPQTLSADGTRYADSGESIVFWSKGDSAFITENGKETYSCEQK